MRVDLRALTVKVISRSHMRDFQCQMRVGFFSLFSFVETVDSQPFIVKKFNGSSLLPHDVDCGHAQKNYRA